ncbi:MAG: hypothetical protein WBR15_06575 [Gammaproteobacteria bacterium]
MRIKRSTTLKRSTALCGSALIVLLLASCAAGSTRWAKYATKDDIRTATVFDLCHSYQNYLINPDIKTEILQRGLLTKKEWDHLVETGLTDERPEVGDKECAIFAQGWGRIWTQESQKIEDDRSIEVWKDLACEPSPVTLFGARCSYMEYTFENNTVKDIKCYDRANKPHFCEDRNMAHLDVRAADDSLLCRGYMNYDLNPGIKTEILRRGLLTETEWNQLVAGGYEGIKPR